MVLACNQFFSIICYIENVAPGNKLIDNDSEVVSIRIMS